MKPMYKAQPDSPNTTLINSIDDSQTIIEVANASTLPIAPSILTLNFDGANTETVLMTLKNGNNLTVVRGVENGPFGFAAGVKIARVLTAYDINTIKENVEEITPAKSPVLTYTNGRLTNITYADGSTKDLIFTNGILTSVVRTSGTKVITKTLNYSNGVLTSIDEIES
jgi:hypothetical protein